MKRALDVVANLTLDEKVSMMSGSLEFWHGMRQLLREDYYHRHPFPAASCPRLGIEGLKFADGPRGVVLFGGATTFPVPMARGASWDPELEERVGDAIGKELRALGANLTGAVCINLLRHPAWGRAQETYGEDPVHIGEMGAALTRGVERHAVACVKHYALNSMENARFSVDVRIAPRALHEMYLPHFKACVEAGASSLMSAYNSVNGEWAGQNQTLLTDILKRRWGFEGFVLTDFIFGVRDGEKAIHAGLDLEMPFPMVWGPELKKLVRSGKVEEARLDEALRRIVAAQLKLPPAGDYDRGVLACDEHRSLAREAAASGMVLLKNNGDLLPLDTGAKLVILGDMAEQAVLGDRGSSDGRPDHAVSFFEGIRGVCHDVSHFPDLSTEEARRDAGKADCVLVVVGNTYRDEGEYIAPTSAMSKLARFFPPPPRLRWLFGNQVMRPVWHRIVRLLLTAQGRKEQRKLDRGSASFGRGGDRSTLALAQRQQDLIARAAETNDRTVVAVISGSAVTMEGWRDRVPAILMTWYAGMEGGHALADVLFGRTEPGGRLPFVIPRDEQDLPEFDLDATQVTYDLWHGYRMLDRDRKEPAFPFGFGLGFSDITLANIEIAQNGSDFVDVQVTAKNCANRSGSTVVQVYVSKPDSAIERAPRELKAFRKCWLGPGTSQLLRIRIPLERLAYFDELHDDFVLEPGTYEILVGQHSLDNAALSRTFSIATE